MEYSGAWGKLIHEENQKQKISWHCPLGRVQVQNVETYAFTLLHNTVNKSVLSVLLCVVTMHMNWPKKMNVVLWPKEVNSKAVWRSIFDVQTS